MVLAGEPVRPGPGLARPRAWMKSLRRRRSRSCWQCCACPKGDAGGSVWPAPATFYCCRADLVADMARSRVRRDNNNDSDKSMDVGDDEFLDEVAEEALPDETFLEVFNRSHEGDSDEQWTVNNLELPYVENLPRQLEIGRAIVVEGEVPPFAEKFAINLSCGAGKEPDIAFHLNPRFDRGYVARNSRIKGVWGEEEGAALGRSPFERAKHFVIHILVTATSFKVSVNRMHFCNFQYRMPLSKVCRLEIHGDVTVSSVKHTRLEVYPDRRHIKLPEHSFITIPTDHAVPWETDLPNVENLVIGHFVPNLRPGLEVTVKGRVKLLPQSLYINLQQGSQLWPHPNIHFHLNPRFAAEDWEHRVIVNSWLRGSWGSEEKYSRCRFRPGQLFTLTIYVEEERYRVVVNGLQQAAMHHRAPPSAVDTLVVHGDIYISHVGLSQSAPPPERLPSPSSATASLAGSFVNIAMATSGTPFSYSPDSRSLQSMSEVDHGFVSVRHCAPSSKDSTANEKCVASSSESPAPANVEAVLVDKRTSPSENVTVGSLKGSRDESLVMDSLENSASGGVG